MYTLHELNQERLVNIFKKILISFYKILNIEYLIYFKPQIFNIWFTLKLFNIKSLKCKKKI
jgi:hypothetical protein